MSMTMLFASMKAKKDNLDYMESELNKRLAKQEWDSAEGWANGLADEWKALGTFKGEEQCTRWRKVAMACATLHDNTLGKL